MTADYIPKEIEHILQYFKYDHLPDNLRSISRPFSDLALRVRQGRHNRETIVALRKLLEAKDAAVRAELCKD